MSPWIPLFSLLMVGPAPATGSPPPTARATDPAGLSAVRLEVDHRALLAKQMAAAAEDSAFFVRDDGTQALREHHGVDVVDDDGVPAIVVTLAWKDYEGSVYLIEIGTQRPSETYRVLESFEATCINNSALTRAVLDKLPAALEQLAAAEPAQIPPTPSETDFEDPPDQTVPVDPPDDRPGRQPLGLKGKIGIGLLAGGVAGLVTGGIVFAQRRQYDQNDAGDADWRGRDFRPPGIAVLVAGGALAATGVALLVVDRVQAQRRARAAKPGARLVPTWRGIAVRGQF